MLKNSPDGNGSRCRGRAWSSLVAGVVVAVIGLAPVLACAEAGQDVPGQDHAGKAADSKTAPVKGPEAKLKAMGIELRTPPPPSANFVRAVRTGNLVFLAGHGPAKPEGGYVQGRLGETMTVEQGYEASRLAAVALLASLKAEIGDLDTVTRIVKVTGMVNSAPSFTNQSAVVNGCSDFLVEVFGEAIGKHARAAVGMASLPIGFAVEIEMIVEVAP